jgi:hypothetical protein
VNVIGDQLNEPDETFFFQLSNSKFATIVREKALGTILNDDPLPVISIADAMVVEGDDQSQEVVLAVTLSASSGQTVAVDFATEDDTALAGEDYEATRGTLVWPGENLGVTERRACLLEFRLESGWCKATA